MGNLQRLQRVVKSWTGVFREDPSTPLDYAGARAILTHLGHQMSSPVYTELMNNDSLLFDFLQQYYAAEKELGKSLVLENMELDPVYEPKVFEEKGKVTIAIKRGTEYEILAELGVSG